MNNKENIVEKAMDVNVSLQGQGANVNENDNEQNYISQQNLHEEKIEMEYQNLSSNIEENMNKSLNTDASNNSLPLDEHGTPRDITETVGNNSNLATNTEKLNHKQTFNNEAEPSVDIKTQSSETSEMDKIAIVCEIVGDMCVMKVADMDETNSNNTDENSLEDQDNPPADSKFIQNDSTVSNNNGETSTENRNPIENVSSSSQNSEATSADGSSKMLVDQVKISPEKKKSKETPSKVVLNRQSESLKSLMVYDGDSDSEHSDTEPGEEGLCYESSEDEDNNTNSKQTWRKNNETTSDTSDSESDSSASTLSLESDSDEENSDGDSGSVIDASDDGIRGDNSSVLSQNNDKGAVKKKNPNILDLEEFLPPLPDLSKLNINVDEAEFLHMGRISAIISELVTIHAIPGTPAFDLDSMLFIDDKTSKKPIGPIFDVLGPVAEPIYCVRFHNEKEVEDMGLKSGMKVYAIPKNDELTKYVFVQELMKIKGSDASWLHDKETPIDLAEFSDDEKEREARRAKKTSTKRKLDDGSLERHQRYERTMNQCNTLNTRVCRLMDAHKNLSRHIRPNATDDIKQSPQEFLDLPTPPRYFDPTVPPPGFGESSLYAPSFQYFNSIPGYDGFPDFTTNLSPHSSGNGSYSPFGFGSGASYGSEAQGPYGHSMFFRDNHGHEPPAPQHLCLPPARWSSSNSRDAFGRPPRFNNPTPIQHNSDSYFTNNSRNFRGAGPSSSQP